MAGGFSVSIMSEWVIVYEFLQAIALCQYLETLGSGTLSGRRVIELGAGTGLTGMVASALGNAGLVSIAPLFIGLVAVNSTITAAAESLQKHWALSFCDNNLEWLYTWRWTSKPLGRQHTMLPGAKIEDSQKPAEEIASFPSPPWNEATTETKLKLRSLCSTSSILCYC